MSYQLSDSENRGMGYSLCLVFFLLLPLCCGISMGRADTVYLKSGKIIHGTMLEETDAYIRIDYNGVGVYYERKKIERIERDDATEIHGEDYLRDGLAFAGQGAFDKAQEVLEKGLRENPLDYNISGALGILQDYRSDKIEKEFAIALFQGSYALMDASYKEAIDYLNKALEIKPGDVDVFYNLGFAYYSIGDYRQAIHYLKQAIGKRPDDPWAYGLLGNAYYAEGRYQDARETLMTARNLYQRIGDQESVQQLDDFLKNLPL